MSYVAKVLKLTSLACVSLTIIHNEMTKLTLEVENIPCSETLGDLGPVHESSCSGRSEAPLWLQSLCPNSSPREGDARDGVQFVGTPPGCAWKSSPDKSSPPSNRGAKDASSPFGDVRILLADEARRSRQP